MIKGFEEQTCELNELEIAYARLIAIALLKIHAINPNKYVTNKDLIRIINTNSDKQMKTTTSSARIRKIIQWLRLNNHPKNFVVVSSSKGYKLSKDTQEIQELVESLESRANAIRMVAYSVKKSLLTIA